MRTRTTPGAREVGHNTRSFRRCIPSGGRGSSTIGMRGGLSIDGGMGPPPIVERSVYFKVEEMASHMFVTSASDLERLLGVPIPRIRNEARAEFHDCDIRWIGASSLCYVATADRHGHMDVSPKGDPPRTSASSTDEHSSCRSARALGAEARQRLAATLSTLALGVVRRLLRGRAHAGAVVVLRKRAGGLRRRCRLRQADPPGDRDGSGRRGHRAGFEEVVTLRDLARYGFASATDGGKTSRMRAAALQSNRQVTGRTRAQLRGRSGCDGRRRAVTPTAVTSRLGVAALRGPDRDRGAWVSTDKR